jgi:hypothetical protein
MVREIAGVMLAGVILLSSACSSPDTKTNAAPPATSSAQSTAKQINKTFTIQDAESSAVVTLVSMDTPTVGGMDTKPESGTFAVFHLKMEGKSGSFSTNYLFARLRTASGTVVTTTTGKGGFHSMIEPALKAARLGPGDTAEGNVVFDTKIEPGTSLYWADTDDKPLAVWEL